MKILQQVRDKLNTASSIDVASIINQIEKYDIVSFDIFDTLLKRNVKKPTDVFEYIEKKNNKIGFCEQRIAAEKRARTKKNGVEVMLSDIYAEMPYDFSSEELEAEGELLIANDWLLPVYKHALKSKRVIITSDMYLPEEFICQILEREGLGGYDKLYLSSSVGKTKYSGELFELIIGELGKENRLIHVGDSYRSDFEVPKKHGVDAIYIPRKIEKNTFKLKEVGIEENIINSFLNNTSPIGKSKYYRFGYEKFGMFLWGYSKWLHKSVKDSDIKDVYFFSRDGLIMKKAFDALYNDVQTHYLEVSRRSLRVPILWMNYELPHVINMISPSKLVSLTSIFDGVGLDINNYRSLIEKYDFTAETTFDRKELLENKNLNSLYSELGSYIETVSKKEYELLVKYIEQNHLSGKFAIVDIGWSGGMQRYLIETLNKLGIDASIKGYYIGVADYYKRNIEVVPYLDLDGYLFDFLHDKNAKDKRSAFVGLFETLFLEQGGSVKNYRVENENVTANRLPYEYLENGKPTFEYRNVIDIQRGALDFITRFGNMELNVSADTLYAGLSETGLKPKKADIDMFADFRFFDEGETLYLAKPKSVFYYIFHVGNLKRDFLSSRWKIGFMKRLFKISLPYEEIYRAMLKYK
ncbi:TPA: HAD-IA family hydrolase [Streptococcus suis]